MGTASTMACLAEAMGLTLPMAASAPATSAERIRLAEETGRRAVALAEAGGPTVADLLTPGGLPQRPRRPAGDRRLDQRRRPPRRHRRPPRPPARPRRARRARPPACRSSSTSSRRASPTWPSSTTPAACRASSPRSPTSSTPRRRPSAARRSARSSPASRRATRTASSAAATTRWCRSAPSPSSPATSRPRGAVIKHSAASPELQQHEGRAVVFDSVEDMALRLDDDGDRDRGRTTSSCCATPARAARPACPRPATSRSRAGWPGRGSRTWCASPTPG